MLPRRSGALGQDTVPRRVGCHRGRLWRLPRHGLTMHRLSDGLKTDGPPGAGLSFVRPGGPTNYVQSRRTPAQGGQVAARESPAGSGLLGLGCQVKKKAAPKGGQFLAENQIYGVGGAVVSRPFTNVLPLTTAVTVKSEVPTAAIVQLSTAGEATQL